MKEYTAHFSYYSEIFGGFEEKDVKVEAANQFDARRTAWDLLDNAADMNFASCIKLCGITWDASKLDIQDYFNAEAAHEKYRINYFDNIELPNAAIQGSESSAEHYKEEKRECYGSLLTIAHIADDLYKPLGILPPTHFDDIHYAREFLNLVDGLDYERYNALNSMIGLAEKWDSNALFSARELLQHGYCRAGGFDFDFSDQFGKDGVYPVCADRRDNFAGQYIHQWTNAREYQNWASLPFFGEKDVVPGSQTTQYEWHTLVINKEALPPKDRTVVNLLWTVQYNEDDQKPGANKNVITVENPITGETSKRDRSDFLGILRPEKYAKINFDGIKAEYQAHKAEKERAPGTDKPSILKTVEENKSLIASADRPDKPGRPGKDHNAIG